MNCLRHVLRRQPGLIGCQRCAWTVPAPDGYRSVGGAYRWWRA